MEHTSMRQTKKLPPGVQQCPACYNNLCKKHPRQDSGASVANFKPSQPGETLDKLYNDLVAKNLAKAKMEQAAARAEVFEKAAATAAHAEAKRGGKEFVRDVESAVGIKPVAARDDSSDDSSSSSRSSRSSSSSSTRSGDRDRGRPREKEGRRDDREGRKSRSRSREKKHRRRRSSSRSRSRSRDKHKKHSRRHRHRRHRSRDRHRDRSGDRKDGSRDKDRDRRKKSRSRSRERRRERSRSRERKPEGSSAAETARVPRMHTGPPMQATGEREGEGTGAGQAIGALHPAITGQGASRYDRSYGQY